MGSFRLLSIGALHLIIREHEANHSSVTVAVKLIVGACLTSLIISDFWFHGVFEIRVEF